MNINGYQQVENKWLISDLTVADCDSLSSLRMCFRNYSFSHMPVAQKTKIKSAGFSLFSKQKWEEAESFDETEFDGSDLHNAESVSN
jgi:hypothetical protein